MSQSRRIEVTLGASPGARLDKALADAVPEGLGLSRSRIQALIAAGAVTRAAGGPPLEDAALRVAGGERLNLTLPEPAPARDAPEAIPLAIAYEDAAIIIIDKPAGMVVHPAPGARCGTLVNALLHHCGDALEGVGGTRRPGIVHRLDKETSGLLVAAKTAAAHAALSAAFKARAIERAYLAIAWGVPDAAEPRLAGIRGAAFEGPVLRIEGDIARHPSDRKRMAVLPGRGRPAVTRARVLEPLAGRLAALIECRLETGRTHQIRVHMAHIGHPLVGDPVYGRRRSLASAVPAPIAEALRGFPRQALHAARLGFRHPATGEAMAFESPPPADFTTLCQVLRNPGGEETLVDRKPRYKKV